MKTVKETYIRNATMVRVIDGDTVELDVDLGFNISHRITCRLEGIDAPETRTAAGKEVKSWLTNMLPKGNPVIVQTVEDKTEKFGRYLANVFLNTNVDGKDVPISVNEVMLSKGFAVKYTGGKRT